MKEKAETVETEIRESMSHRLEQGYILPGQADLLFSSKTILADAHTPHTIFMTGLDQRLPGMTPKAKYSLTGKELKLLPEQLRDPDQGPDEMEEGRLPRRSPLRVEDQGEPPCWGLKGV